MNSQTSHSNKHNPQAIYWFGITGTKLPFPHTRKERIIELKEFVSKQVKESPEYLYGNYLINELNNETDGHYLNRVEFMHKLSEKYRKHEGTQTKGILEKQIQGLLVNPGFTMTEENYQKFLGWVKGITFESGSSEMALAYITIMVMSDDDFIINRDRRTQDLLTLVKAIIHIYNHAFESKSTLLLVIEALDANTDISDVDFRNKIIRGETNFERVIACVRKPIQPQPTFVL